MGFHALHQVFAALSDPTRLNIIEHLLNQGEANAGQLVALSGLTGPAVSRHLKVLRDAGLVERRTEGQRRVYSMAPCALADLRQWARMSGEAVHIRPSEIRKAG